MIVPIVLADEYSVGYPMTITAYYIDNATPTDIDNITIDIHLPTGVQDIFNESMTNVATGKYEYIYTPPISGIYTLMVHFYDNNTLIGSSSGTFSVDARDKLTFGQCPETTTGQTNMWIITGIFLLLGIVGMFTRIPGLAMLGGFGLIFMSLITWGCGAIIGYGLIITGVTYLMIALNIRT